jgi:hypothetical protein
MLIVDRVTSIVSEANQMSWYGSAGDDVSDVLLSDRKNFS